MIARCEQPNHISWKNYGAIGVKVCERWHSFDDWLADMGPRPPGYSIDRKDAAKGYEPGNCKWSSRAEQARNKRTVKLHEVDGRKLCVLDWANEFGINYDALKGRLARGWSIREALGLEPKAKRPHTPSREAHYAKMRASKNMATHCPHGHEFTDKNTLVGKDGYRRCRTCCQERDRLRSRK